MLDCGQDDNWLPGVLSCPSAVIWGLSIVLPPPPGSIAKIFKTQELDWVHRVAFVDFMVNSEEPADGRACFDL